MSLEVTHTNSLQPSIGDDSKLSTGAQTPATLDVPEPTLNGDVAVLSEQVPEPAVPATGGLQFWLIFIALMVSTFLSAIDLVGAQRKAGTAVSDLGKIID